MSAKEISKIVDAVKRFKLKLEEDEIPTRHKEILIKVYIRSLTKKINVDILQNVV